MTALRLAHRPDDYAQVGAAQRRFRFEEALVLQLVLARRRAAQRALGAVARRGGGRLLERFDDRLPFDAHRGPARDRRGPGRRAGPRHPMNRLLQGEVGSGKTLVALRAMLRVVDSGGQAVLLAPTEVLAQQHHRSISALLGDLAQGGMLGGAAEATSVVLLTGSMGKTARDRALQQMSSGEAGIVIGTHALLEESVELADLGLVVVDEQHRFGVEQRAALTDKAGTPPHVLVMTATPIPRTVAMTVFGDLETSVLSELPAGRAPIQTNVVPLAEQPAWIARVWERVREEVAAGHQAYVVCPRISGDTQEEGERDQVDVDEDGEVATERCRLAAVEDVHAELERRTAGRAAGRRAPRPAGRRREGPHHARLRRRRDRRARLHHRHRGGRRRPQRHHDGAPRRRPVRRLPAPPAARPGRPGRPARAVPAGLARRGGTPARERLDAVASTTDGFELSRIDLEQRREGDVLGADQSGFRSSLVSLRVLRDEGTIDAGPRGGRGAARRGPRARRRPPSSPRRCRRSSGPARPASWRSRDADHRGQRRGTPAGDAARLADAPDQRPRARGAVLGGRGVVRLAGRAAVPRPVRRLGRGRPRGLVARAPGWSPWWSRTGAPPRSIARNAKALGFARADVVAAVGRRGAAQAPAAPYDVVFLDPPYPLADDEVTADLASLVEGGWLVPGALVVVERASRGPALAWPDGLDGERSKRYGETDALVRSRRLAGPADRRADRGVAVPCAEPSAPGPSTR